MHRTFRLISGLFLFLILGTAALHAQWEKVLTQNGAVSAIVVNGENIYCASDVDGAFLSTDNGDTWTPINDGLDTRVHDFAVIGTNLFAGTLGGVFLSTDNGTSWTAVNTGLTNLNVYPLQVMGTNLFAGTTPGGVFLSTDNGSNWSEVNTGLTNTVINELVVIGSNLFAATNGGVFLSTDNGSNWTKVSTGLTGTQANSFAVNGTDLFAGVWIAGVFLSTDSGTSWTAVNNGLTDLTILSLLKLDGMNILAGTYGSGVFLSTDYGANWSQFNSGLNDVSYLNISALAVKDNYLFAGNIGDATGVWRRALSDVTSVEETLSNDVPLSYSLKQNYPNPFNPSTKIKYSVPEESDVTIKVYDILGNEIVTLINEKKQAGTYELTWKSENLSGGVYFYQLRAGEFVQTKKMLLLK